MTIPCPHLKCSLTKTKNMTRPFRLAPCLMPFLCVKIENVKDFRISLLFIGKVPHHKSFMHSEKCLLGLPCFMAPLEDKLLALLATPPDTFFPCL